MLSLSRKRLSMYVGVITVYCRLKKLLSTIGFSYKPSLFGFWLRRKKRNFLFRQEGSTLFAAVRAITGRRDYV